MPASGARPARAGGEAAHRDVLAGVPSVPGVPGVPGVPETVLQLFLEPALGAAAERLRAVDGNLGGTPDAAVEQNRVRVARDRESLRGLGHRESGRLEARAADECGGRVSAPRELDEGSHRRAGPG